MKKKVLMLASVASMIDQFNMSNIHSLKELGYEVHVAANFINGNTSSKKRIDELKGELEKLNVPYYQVGFSRKITNVSENLKAYMQVKTLMKKNNYEFVHCHSPIGGFCGRIAGYKTKTPVIYTAHGFHFYKGAPLKNWILYYPIERLLARFTNILITINLEDFNRAKTFKSNRVEYIPGIGIDTVKFKNINSKKGQKQKELNIPEDSLLVVSVGELNENKNHETVIKAISKLNNPNIYYVICGQGRLDKYLNELISRLGLEKQVKLLGFREDVNDIYKAANLFAFLSYREGLSVALMEAMASELPVVCSKIRGNTDLLDESKGGYLVEPNDVDNLALKIKSILDSPIIQCEMGKYNFNKIQNFNLVNVNKKMIDIYKGVVKRTD